MPQQAVVFSPELFFFLRFYFAKTVNAEFFKGVFQAFVKTQFGILFPLSFYGGCQVIDQLNLYIVMVHIMSSAKLEELFGFFLCNLSVHLSQFWVNQYFHVRNKTFHFIQQVGSLFFTFFGNEIILTYTVVYFSHFNT